MPTPAKRYLASKFKPQVTGRSIPSGFANPVLAGAAEKKLARRLGATAKSDPEGFSHFRKIHNALSLAPLNTIFKLKFGPRTYIYEKVKSGDYKRIRVV